MIVKKKELNTNTNEEINIIIKIEYPNIEYNDWKRTKEFNTDNDICNILDKIFVMKMLLMNVEINLLI